MQSHGSTEQVSTNAGYCDGVTYGLQVGEFRRAVNTFGHATRTVMTAPGNGTG